MPWLVGLNALRFFAIVLIVVYHLFRRSLPGGFIAVDIFFAISGFLTISGLLRQYASTGRVHYREFLKKRFWRLFPLLLVCVLLTLTLALAVNRDILAGVQLRTAAALTFTTNLLELFSGGDYENTISPNLFEHSWFLALEMQLLLSVGLLTKLGLSLGSRRNRAIRNMGFAYLAMAILSNLLMIGYGGRFGEINRAYFAIDTHMGAFCLGAALAAFNHLVPRTPRTPKLIPALGMAMSLLIITILASKTEYSDPFTFLFVLPFTGVLAIIMIFCIIKLQSNRHSRRNSPLLIRLLEYLGSLSFGIYLFHYPLHLLLPELLPNTAPGWLAPTLTLSLSFVLAWLFADVLNLEKFFRFSQLNKKRRLSRVATLAICCAPAIVLLATTPVRSQISQQLDSVEQAEFHFDEDYQPDYVGVQALEQFSANIVPIFQSLQNEASAASGHHRPAMSANSASVLIIGDSVTLGAKAELESIIANSFVDAQESRGIESATTILAGYAAAGKLPDTIVLSLATNERTITDGLLQSIVDVAGDGHSFVLVSAYAGPQQPREAQNAALKGYAERHSNVVFADWWQLAHDNWSLMYADHIHLNPEGRLTYARLINNAVRGVAK